MIFLLYLYEANAIQDIYGHNSQVICTVNDNCQIHDSFFINLGNLQQETSSIVVEGTRSSKNYNISIYKCVFIDCKSKNYAAMKIEGDFSTSISFICLSNCSSNGNVATIYTKVTPNIFLSYITAEYCTSPKKNLNIHKGHNIENINYSYCSVTQIERYLPTYAFSYGIFTPEDTAKKSNLSFSNFYTCNSGYASYYIYHPNSDQYLNSINFINNTIDKKGIIHIDINREHRGSVYLSRCIFQDNTYKDRNTPIFSKRDSVNYYYLMENNYLDHKITNYIKNNTEYFTTNTDTPIYEFFMTAKCEAIKPYGKNVKESNYGFYANSLRDTEIMMLYIYLCK